MCTRVRACVYVCVYGCRGLNNGELTENSITIEFEGKLFYKASVLRLISTGVGLKKSGDRLRRVQGLSKYCTALKNSDEASEIGDNIVTVKDQLATLVSSNGRDVSLVVLLADKITDSMKKVKHTIVDKLSVNILITGRPLQLKFDMQIGALCWSVGEKSKVAEISVSLLYCATVEPTFQSEMKYSFENNDINDIFQALLSEYETSQRKLPRSTVSYDANIMVNVTKRREAIPSEHINDEEKAECLIIVIRKRRWFGSFFNKHMLTL